MPRNRRRLPFAPLAAALLVLAPAAALAGKLDVTVTEREDGAVVRITSDDATVPEPDVARSRRGLLLFFPGEEVETERIYSKAKRLRYVQTGTARGKAAVRIVQRPNARGPIREFAHLRPIPGGYEVEVVDSYPPAPETTPAPAGAAAPATDAPTTGAPAAAAPIPDEAERVAALEGLLEVPSAPGSGAGAGDVPSGAPDAPAKATAAGSGAADRAASSPSAPGAAAEGTGDAPANDPSSAPPAPGTARSDVFPTSGSEPPSLLPHVLGLAFVVFGGLGLWWAGRLRRRRRGAVEVRERIQIGPKQSVVCMRVAGRDLLIGATEHTVALLAEFDAVDGAARSAAPAATADAEPDAPSPASAGNGDDPTRAKLDAFKRRLAEAMAKPPTAEPEGSAQVEFSIPTRDPAWVRHREVA